jgi:hypothetical protein
MWHKFVTSMLILTVRSRCLSAGGGVYSPKIVDEVDCQGRSIGVCPSELLEFALLHAPHKGWTFSMLFGPL